MLRALLVRDIRLATRIGGGAIAAVFFFFALVAVVPFAIGPDLALLRRIGPAILWLGALLASLLALDRLFADDQADGSLDVLLMGGGSLELTVAAKAIAHWLTTGVPLLIAAPLLGLLLNMEPRDILLTELTLAAGTPALTLIGLIGAAISVTLRRGGLLLPVLIFPLTIPVLIFGVSAASAEVLGVMPFTTPFAILCALSLFALVIGPFAAAATLRQGLE